jgi:eukaryotic-like serine/threonine-protein kinase
MEMPSAPTVTRLGRYQVSRHLASGGMAEIYLATCGVDTVVVKVISAGRDGDKKFIQMFLDEARVAATLNHPNIAQMLEVGRQDDTYFLAIEWVDGENVRAMLERAVSSHYRIPLPVCQRIVASVAAGLHHAHQSKGANGAALEIVHRDVTPSNIQVSWDGVVKLLDFGIAQAKNRSQETLSGTIKGKFAYMSPEQCRGKGVDRRTDVFALGIVMYELTTQRRAFRTDNDFETMDRIVKGKLNRPSTIDPAYPRELEEIVMTALATDADQRYATAAEFGRALDDYGRRTGHNATAADVATCMHDLFRATPGDRLAATAEGTESEVDMVIDRGLPSRDVLAVGDTTHRTMDDDAATTFPRLSAKDIAASIIYEAKRVSEMQPSSTGPMPVMPPSRPSGAVDVLKFEPATYDPATSTGPVARLNPEEWVTTHKTMIGTGPVSVVRPPSSDAGIARPPLGDSARMPRPVLPPIAAPPQNAAAAISLPEPTVVRRRQRRGLVIALVAVIVVAIAATAALILAGGTGASTTIAAPR